MYLGAEMSDHLDIALLLKTKPKNKTEKQNQKTKPKNKTEKQNRKTKPKNKKKKLLYATLMCVIG
jgi:hypothetical protein